MKRLETMTWAEIRGAAKTGATLVVPTGSMEQHGPHLPVHTDTLLVSEVAERAVSGITDRELILAPTLWLGASHHHRCFFALSVDEELYVRMISEMGCSAAEAGFRRLFLLNGHGGNTAPLKIALAKIQRRHPSMLVAAADYWSIGADTIRSVRTSGPGGAAHAGELETSMVMYLEPDLVRGDDMDATLPDVPPELTMDLVDGGSVYLAVDRWDRLSERGALGDPGVATPDAGQRFLDGIVQAVTAVLRRICDLDPTA